MTLSDETRSLTVEEWNVERFGKVCTAPDSFGNWKASILKLCRLAGNRCTFDTKKKIIIFSGKIQGFADRVENVKLQYPHMNLDGTDDTL